MLVPFPVETPYAMRPHMKVWEPGEPILTKDHLFEQYQAEKLRYYRPVYGDNASTELVESAVTALQKYDSSAPTVGPVGGAVWQLTSKLQEDFVIWAPNKNGDLSAQVLSVCLPSGWDPATKANKTFLEIHEPVPDFNTVNKAAEHIAKMITTKGPFIRHVWTISNSPALSRLPANTQPWTDEQLDRMWYRVERQVTVPIDGVAALFLIRVYQQPLAQVFEDSVKRQAIIDSIASMTENVLQYKNLNWVKNYLKNYSLE